MNAVEEMSAVEDWTARVGEIGRKLADAELGVAVLDGERGRAALDVEQGFAGAEGRWQKLERKHETAVARVASLKAAKSEAEARLAAAREEEGAVEERAQEEQVREQVARCLAHMKGAQDGMDLVAKELKEAEEARAEIRKLRLPVDRVAQLSSPLDPLSVASRLHSYGGSIGLDTWLTESESAYRRTETRTLVEMEEEALARYLEHAK